MCGHASICGQYSRALERLLLWRAVLHYVQYSHLPLLQHRGRGDGKEVEAKCGVVLEEAADAGILVQSEKWEKREMIVDSAAAFHSRVVYCHTEVGHWPPQSLVHGSTVAMMNQFLAVACGLLEKLRADDPTVAVIDRSHVRVIFQSLEPCLVKLSHTVWTLSSLSFPKIVRGSSGAFSHLCCSCCAYERDLQFP